MTPIGIRGQAAGCGGRSVLGDRCPFRGGEGVLRGRDGKILRSRRALGGRRHGGDDRAAEKVARLLVARAGRIVENRMTTGLAVTPPMQHGGPWPSAGPPFFSAVGMPWSILRFARRICFDGWSPERLPECLRDPPPAGRPWRYVDGGWTRD